MYRYKELSVNTYQKVKNNFRSILIILYSVLIFIILLFIDFRIITPLILPEDHCYYHFHETPFLVNLLYINGSSNGHPEWSFTHIILLVFISIFIGVYIKRKHDASH